METDVTADFTFKYNKVVTSLRKKQSYVKVLLGKLRL